MFRFVSAAITAGLCISPALSLAAEWSLAQTVAVIATEYQFSPNALSFKRGVRYRLHLENHGKEQHEFTAPEFFKTVRLRNAKALNADRTEVEIPPGTVKDLFFVPQQAGLYRLRCSDHDWAGMTGEIIVK